MTELVDKGIVYKKRGIGMFVSPNARDILIEERKKLFTSQFIEPLKAEARRLGISEEELRKML